MRAIVHKKYGPPSVAYLAEIDKPTPKPNELLVKVYASTVNRTDAGLRSAEYFISRFFTGLFKPYHQVLGNEFSGIIEACGDDVLNFKVGDHVFGFNDKTFGGHAEYLTIPYTAGVAILPNNIDVHEGASIIEGAHYALNIIRSAKVKSGQKVLVNGATGAIGSAAVQLLTYFGAHVTAVCNTKNVEMVKKLGATTVIDYQKSDFTKFNHQFHFIFDAVGKSSFFKCKPLLFKNGVYISTELGKHSQNVFLALISPFYKGKKVKFPIPEITKDDVVFLKTLVEQQLFKPVIDKYFKLEEIEEAYTYVETGQKTGNVILLVSR